MSHWERLEARVGIEPTHKGFADLSLTTWVPRLNSSTVTCSAPEIQHGCPGTAQRYQPLLATQTCQTPRQPVIVGDRHACSPWLNLRWWRTVSYTHLTLPTK